MESDLPFEPSDALNSIKELLPSVTFPLTEPDLRRFIVDGFLSRRFVLFGRFTSFAYTVTMASEVEMTVKHLLETPIPSHTAYPVYEGNAVGFLVDSHPDYYTRESTLRLIDIPTDSIITFVYKRPSLWQAVRLGGSSFADVRYEDDLEATKDLQRAAPPLKAINQMDTMLGTPKGQKFLMEALSQAMERRSRSGYSRRYLIAMQAVALLHRISRRFSEAVILLQEALALFQDRPLLGTDLELSIRHDLGRVFIDLGKVDLAEEEIYRIIQRTPETRLLKPDALHLKCRLALAEISFNRGNTRRSIELTLQVQKLQGASYVKRDHEYWATSTKLGAFYRAHGATEDALKTCRETMTGLESLENRSNRSELIRAWHNLAKVLCDCGRFAEAEVLYQREIIEMREFIGLENLFSIRIFEALACTYYEESDLTNALSTWEILTNLIDDLQGPNHSDKVESVYQKALILGRLNQYSQGIQLLEHILRQDRLGVLDLSQAARSRISFLLSNLYKQEGNNSKPGCFLESFHSPGDRIPDSNISPDSFTQAPSPGIDGTATMASLEIKLREVLARRAENTCNWIFQDSRYISWVATDAPALLLLTGPPGSGKTTLFSSIVQALRSQQHQLVFYFFEVAKPAGLDLLRSLLYQLNRVKSPTSPGLASSIPTITPLSKLFRDFTERTLDFGTIYCCIDGLDECDESITFLLRSISNLVQSKTFPIKFLLSSPPSAYLNQELIKTAVNIRVPTSETASDIERYISEGLAHLNLEMNSESQSQLVEKLVKEAGGLFLWARLAIASIRKGEAVDLESMPKSVSDFYTKIISATLATISRSESILLTSLLQWVALATQPLTLTELGTALAIDPHDEQFQELKIFASLVEFISNTRGLLQVLPDRTVALVHTSLRDFLFPSRETDVDTSLHFPYKISKTLGESSLAIICLTYLSFDTFIKRYPEDTQQKAPFLEYAACNWYHHAIRAHGNRDVFLLATRFLSSMQGFQWLEGLQELFGKSAEDILVIQSQIYSWVSTSWTNASEVATGLVLQAYEVGLKSDSKIGKPRSSTLRRLADFYQAAGNFGRAEELYKGILSKPSSLDIRDRVVEESLIRVDNSRPVDSEYVRTVKNLGNVFKAQGKFTEAEDMYRKALEVQERALGPEHVSTLDIVSNLAGLYSDQGNFAAAEAMYQRTLSGMDKLLTTKHPETLSSMNNLASVLSSQGKYNAAEEMYRKALLMSAHGKEHPSTLSSLNQLSSVLNSQGKYHEAEAMNRQTLEVLEKILGREHPSTLSSLSNLASALNSQGKYNEAEAIDRQTLEIRKKVLGREHPSTLSTMDNLAVALSHQGKFAEAKELHRHALYLKERVLGKEHPSTLTSMSSLAVVHFQQGNYAEAETMEREALYLKEKVLGKEHPLTLTSMSSLAVVHFQQGKYDEAEKMEREALYLKKKVLGKEHPLTLTSMSSLAVVYFQQGKFAEAEKMEQEALYLKEKVLGKSIH